MTHYCYRQEAFIRVNNPSVFTQCIEYNLYLMSIEFHLLFIYTSTIASTFAVVCWFLSAA